MTKREDSVYIENRIGPRKEHSGTPQESDAESKASPTMNDARPVSGPTI